MKKFVIFVTNIVFQDEDGEYGCYSFQTALSYLEEYDPEDVRISVGKHNLGIFLNTVEPNRSIEDVVNVSTFPLGKHVLKSYIDHLAMVN